MSIEAMKQALEALEELHRTGDTQVFDMCYAPKVIPALRQAIEQAEKEQQRESLGVCLKCGANECGSRDCPINAQTQREWVGLTDDEIDQGLLRSDYALQTAHAWRAGVVFAMTQLKEKNT